MADTLMFHRQSTIEALSGMSSDRESEDESESVTLSLARQKAIARGPSIYEEEVEEEDDDEDEGDDVMLLRGSESRGLSSRRYGDENSPRTILNDAMAQPDRSESTEEENHK